MSSVDSRVLMEDISAEVATNPAVSGLVGATIHGYVEQLGQAFAQREGLDPASIEEAGANLFAARSRGRGAAKPAGPSEPEGDSPWGVREWGNAVSIALGIEHVLNTYVAPLFSGIGAGRPAENEERFEQEQDEFAQCVDELRGTMHDGGQSLGEIVKSMELSSNIFLQLALRVLKAARMTTVAGISSGLVVDLAVSALQNAKEVNDDGNACIADILDEMVCQCEEVAEKEPVAPQPTYGRDTKEPGAPKGPVAEPIPKPRPAPESEPAPETAPAPGQAPHPVQEPSPAPAPKETPVAGDTSPSPGAEKNAAMEKQLEAESVEHKKQVEEPIKPEAPAPLVPMETISTTAASAGLDINVDLDVDINVDLASSGASYTDASQLKDLAPPSVRIESISDMMQGPMGSSGCASLLGALSLITAECFEGCTSELSPEQPEEPSDVPEPVEPEPEAPEAEPAHSEPESEEPDPDNGVIAPPPELAEVEEPPAPPKKGLIEQPELAEPQTESVTSHESVDKPAAPEQAPDNNDAPEPRSRARKVDSF